jgi:ABC-2 type transport system permease protein
MNLSFHRFVAVLQKELIQARRDRFTLALMMGMPLVQLFLFGFAINTDPKHLPTALVMGDDSRPAAPGGAMRATEYFDVSQPSLPPRPSERWLAATSSSSSSCRWTSPARWSVASAPRCSSPPTPPTPPP